MQKEYIGTHAIEILRDILVEVAPRRIFLVTGKESYEYSGAAELLEPYLSSFACVRFSDFSTNPVLEDIEKGIVLFRKESPDLVIAVGGGSVLDMAKAVNALSQNEGAAREYIEGERALSLKGRPLVAIPTTAGSGSEATPFAVAYSEGKKYSLAHPALTPDWAVVDPQFTYRLPPKITAVTGMDALCQGIESHWSIKATDESRRYATEAVSLALGHLRGAVRKPDEASRDAMARAAHLSGKAIAISKTTAGHAMAYPLTSHFGIPHGHAVALTLPQLMLFNDDHGTATLFGVPNAAQAAAAFGTLMEDIGLATQLRDFGVQESDIPSLAAEVSAERAGNNPRAFTAVEAESIFRATL